MSIIQFKDDKYQYINNIIVFTDFNINLLN